MRPQLVEKHSIVNTRVCVILARVGPHPTINIDKRAWLDVILKKSAIKAESWKAFYQLLFHVNKHSVSFFHYSAHFFRVSLDL